MKHKLLAAILTLLFVFIPLKVLAAPVKDSNLNNTKVKVYLFHGNTCQHCKQAIEYLDELLKDKKYNDVEIVKYQIYGDKENHDKYLKASDILNADVVGVPFIVIGTNSIEGYNSKTNKQLKELIEYYQGKEYQDPVGDYLNNTDTSKKPYVHYEKKDKNSFELPVLGKVNGKSVSLLLVSVVIGMVDGFNPCAMWILLFLLGLLISTKDRKKMWVLGLTFILTSGFIYLMFMLSWLKVAKYTSEIIVIRYLIGVFAAVFGLINLYRFIKSIKNKEVGCDVTDADKKRKIMSRIRDLLSKNKMIFAILGIMLLAVSVNLIELLCSLGLPVVYTEILGINNLSGLQYGFYMFVYLLFFLIDDLIIFFIAMKSLKLKGVSNKYMKYTHLIGGLIMLLVGLLMIIKPSIIMFNF